MGFLSSLLNSAGESVAEMSKYRARCYEMNENELTDELVRMQDKREINKVRVIVKILREQYGYEDADLARYKRY